MQYKMHGSGTDVELRVSEREFEAEMPPEENHCIQHIPWTGYMFVDLCHFLSLELELELAVVVHDDVVMEKVKVGESCVEVIVTWS